MEVCACEHPYQRGEHDRGRPLRPGGTALTVRALELAGFSDGDRVLDLGCGIGAAAPFLQARGCEALGLDCMAERLVRARAGAPALAFVAGDARAPPLATGCLDGILAECVLSLAGYSAETLAECARVLKPGARLAVTDLFARSSARADGSVPGCLGGMVEHGTILAVCAGAGLIVEQWENHSTVLGAFVARLIFESGSPDVLWNGQESGLGLALRKRRPGYFLMIARKGVKGS